MLNYKRFTFNYRHSVFYCISKYYLHRKAHMGNNGIPHQSRRGSNKQRTGAFIGKGYGNLSETLRKRNAGQDQ